MQRGTVSLKLAAMLSAVALIMFTLSLVAFLIIRNEALDYFLPTVTAIAAPAIITLLGFSRVEAKLTDIHQEVNGKSHAMENRITRLEDETLNNETSEGGKHNAN